MVEFDVVHDRDLRQVRHELRLFIEKRRVVLVTLDDEIIAVGDTETGAEILDDAPDQERWVESANFGDPGCDARGGRLSMSTCNYKTASATNELVSNDFGL